ncbi:MAG TPA: GNAT family N-acetyltransferase [Acidobacteriaceae bacterium]|nr:GNAT family N-acetyltransferase [Acidobacteriaceae bacterium]
MRADADVVVRELRGDDAAAVAELSGQLGYPGTAEEVRKRIEAMTRSGDRVAFAAVRAAELVGWIDAAVERHLQADDAVVIGGLVVGETERGCGVGKRLCEEVERWAGERGFARVRVRSQIKRADAHRFYLRDGYRVVKTSLVLEKELD